MGPPRLSFATLGHGAGAGDGDAVRMPAPAHPGTPPGVVHLGLGAFHRAHQAMVFDALLRAGDARWGVLGVAMRSTAVADVLAAQDRLYSVQVASAGGRHWQLVGSLHATCVATRDRSRVIAALAAPSTRWVTLTVTEKGYGPELGGLLAEGLGQRRLAGLPGLTLASCDNLGGNGDLLRALCRDAASGDPALRQWMDGACSFPNSMVDRIVPAATDAARAQAEAALGLRDEAALATEGFWEWVLEDRLADPGDAAVLRAAGVEVVADVKPFETAKLRMLNGSHSAIAAIGAVLGLETVSDCVREPEIRAFVHRLMGSELMPHLKRPRLDAYRDALLARFANPALQHRVHQIASDFSQKIPQRWVPAVSDRLRAGGSVEHLAFAAAAWMRYCAGADEAGRGYALWDPLAADLVAASGAAGGEPQGLAWALLRVGAIWGEELPGDARFAGRASHWLGRMQAQGLRAALVEVGRTEA